LTAAIDCLGSLIAWEADKPERRPDRYPDRWVVLSFRMSSGEQRRPRQCGQSSVGTVAGRTGSGSTTPWCANGCRKPASAIRSMFGVSTNPPQQPNAPNPTSSSTTYSHIRAYPQGLSAARTAPNSGTNSRISRFTTPRDGFGHRATPLVRPPAAWTGRGLPVQVDVFVVMPLVRRVPVPVVQVVQVVLVRDGPVPAAGAVHVVVLAGLVVPVRLGAAHWCRLPSHRDIGGLAVTVGPRRPGRPHLAAAVPSTIPPGPVTGR
jgi:hypothetical protein